MMYAIASPIQDQGTTTRHDDYIYLALHLLARLDELSVNQQSNKQQTNNDQQIAAFQSTNSGKNAALAFVEQIHGMQFYIKKNFTLLL
jgi:hypothetical protein